MAQARLDPDWLARCSETAELPTAASIYLQHRERNDLRFLFVSLQLSLQPNRNSTVDLHFPGRRGTNKNDTML